MASTSKTDLRFHSFALIVQKVNGRDHTERPRSQCRFPTHAMENGRHHRAETSREEQTLMGHELEGMVGHARALFQIGGGGADASR